MNDSRAERHRLPLRTALHRPSFLSGMAIAMVLVAWVHDVSWGVGLFVSILAAIAWIAEGRPR